MSYLVLARKFRPQTFQSIIGQEHITRALANSILWGRVAHAFLFTGPRGVGKTTTARVLARALNCTGRKLPEAKDVPPDANSAEYVEPCGECSNCKEIARSASIAVWEIDGASNNSVENVRELIDSLRSLPPPGSKYKIYIIDEVHMLSTAAFNALLKSLEEPPPNTIFIFATTEPQKIPETVISRCQRHDFHRLSVSVITESLQALAQQEGVEADEEVFEFIALKARGGMRDAQSMLDRFISFSSGKLELQTAQQLFGVVDSSYFFRMSEAVFNQDPAACFLLLDEAFSQSLDGRAFIADFLTHWRNLLVLSLTRSSAKTGDARIQHALEVSKRDLQALSAQIESAESFDLQRLFDLAEKTAETALTSNFPRFILEAGLAKMATLPSLRPLAEIVSRLEAGDDALRVGAVRPQALRQTTAVPAVEKKKILNPPEIPSEISSAAAPEPSPFESKNLEIENLITGNSEAAALPKAEFNPSWQDFINHVRTARSEIMLATFLRRVSPKNFGEGLLNVEAGDFDIQTLKDAGMMKNLKSCLQSYSGIDNWDVRFAVHQPKEGSPASSQPLDSLVSLERKAEKQRISKIDAEARNNPLVQNALAVFEGSSIERVSVLKSEGKDK